MTGTSNSIPATMADQCPIIYINNRIQSLQKQAEHVLQLEDESLTTEEQQTIPVRIHELKTISQLIETSCQGQISSNPHFHAVCCCPFKKVQNMNAIASKDVIDPADPQNKGRYLCVSNGFSICCLDLKQSKDEPNDHCSSTWKVPSKISALILPMEGCISSLGLFRSGSSAYMVGGREIPGLEDSKLSLSKVYRSSDMEYIVKGCSLLKTHHLSLADGGLCLSECDNIKSLNKPRFRPIVEKVDDQVHVMETISPILHRYKIPSHEAFNLNEPIRGWIEHSPMLFPDTEQCKDIPSYIAVGHRIYAWDCFFGEEFVAFDTRVNKWEIHRFPDVFPEQRRLTNIRHVAELVQFGFGSCIGEYPYGDARPPLYVVLAIGRNKKKNMYAVAYLVTKEGQILCFQQVNRFFEGFPEFCGRVDGTVISGGEDGNTKCVIIRGIDKSTLYITTFQWEKVEDAGQLALRVLLEKRGRGKVDVERLPYVEEEDFINVGVKGWYVSDWATELQPYKAVLKRRGADLSACFL